MGVSFLHPPGPAPFYTFPDPEDVLTIDSNDIWTAISPVTATGTSYTISKKETENATLTLFIYVTSLFPHYISFTFLFPFITNKLL